MPEERRFSTRGEESDPNPFGRGCLPVTLFIGFTIAIGGAIGWMWGGTKGLITGAAVVFLIWAIFLPLYSP